MNALAARIASLIAAQGPISVAQFMTLALHDAEAGYYATNNPLGSDFITAPEISQMFGELLGLWCVQLWHDQGRSKSKQVVELGPGRGTMMADALRAMKSVPGFLDGLEIVLVESSPVLQALQAERLAASGVAIRWTTHFQPPAGRPLYLLANEFFDALPIRQYVRTDKGWHERMVVTQKEDLAFALAPAAAPHGVVPESRSNAPPGGVYEVAPAGTALAEEIGRVIAAQGGGALILDYGYGAEAGFGETLQAMTQGRYAGVLDAPGAQDLSAHVDFAALADAARHGGAAVFGPQPQGAFLARMGLAERARRLAEANPKEAPAIAAAEARLSDPDAMGRLFQALAIVPSGSAPPAGFES
jgi:NADH dehydrogenase [ubiquinone] 1 alpha subcomplex assembly factor 7